MLFKIENTKLTILMSIILLGGCDHQSPVGPDESVTFTLKLEFGQHPGTEMLGMVPGASADDTDSTVGKNLNIQAIDLARVMVVDFSAYPSWDDLLERPEWEHYVTARDNWTGDLSQWGESDKLIGNHFNIVTNQVLNIAGDFATGTVTGVIGLNRIAVALIENNRIAYWGEGLVTGGAGEADELEVEVWEYYVEQEP